ncbi:MAG: lamin tail domain-containing protein, partial [Verrucomicrobiales bacterium]|nr:lamin tail domain-containing protein [Verrucomicrobiales bacterium]
MRIRGFTTSAVPAGVWAAACTALYAQPVIHEIHYDPPDRTQPAEFVELHNPSADPVSLAGWQLRGGVSFTFPAGATLPAAGYLVVAQNPDALRAAFGVSAFGPWIGRLRNEDERVELRDAEGGLVDRVDFQLGFPWPTVGTPPGNSIELVHPALDNDLGGNWRPSIAGGGGASARYRWVEAGESWRFFRGRAAPSSPESSWREPGFDAGSWETGRLPIGYDPSLSLRTPLDDMRNGYSTLYLRRPFVVEKADTDYSIELQALYDDGFKVWINGRFVLEANVAGGELRYDGVAASARESESFETFTANLAAGILVPGTNWIAVQVFNSSISASSDCYFDVRLDGVSGPTGQGPTPGRANRAFATVSPPAIRQVEHAPEAPRGGDAVRISAKVTDPEGVKSVALAYQVVEPGAYIELEDPAFETQWTETPMRDDGTGGDSI